MPYLLFTCPVFLSIKYYPRRAIPSPSLPHALTEEDILRQSIDVSPPTEPVMKEREEANNLTMAASIVQPPTSYNTNIWPEAPRPPSPVKSNER